MLCKHEVAGSIPVTSTKIPIKHGLFRKGAVLERSIFLMAHFSFTLED